MFSALLIVSIMLVSAITVIIPFILISENWTNSLVYSVRKETMIGTFTFSKSKVAKHIVTIENENKLILMARVEAYRNA